MMRVISCILLTVTLISFLSAGLSAFSYTQIADEYEWQMLGLINQHRRDAATMFTELQDCAGKRSEELLGNLSHYRPDGEIWYSVLEDKNIPYDTNSFEIIGANFDSPDEFFDAVMGSNMWDKLLYNGAHIGIGYSSSDETKNRNAWCIIGVGCDGIDSIGLHYPDIHFTAGKLGDVSSATVEAVCSHGKSYMQLHSYMVSGYEKYMIGTQYLTVTYQNKTADLVITNDYTDVKPGKWFYDPIMNCTEKGYYSGVADGVFSPSGQMTREMFVCVLGRFADIDAASYTGSNFTDIKSSRWSAPYIKWAADNGIVSGYNDGSFGPTRGITRQEMCSIVKRYIDKFDITIDQTNAEKEFTDSQKIASWAKDAVGYCQTRGIISGDAKGAFNPTNTATRAEVAVIITNLDNILN